MGQKKPVYKIRLHDPDWARLEDLIREGERWIRRNIREWPYGHDLFPQVRQDGNGDDWLHFYFVETDDVPLF
jgi:hypothetical protein